MSDKVVSEGQLVATTNFLKSLSLSEEVKAQRAAAYEEFISSSWVSKSSLSANAVSVLTRKWETVAKLFLLHAEAFSWWLWRLSLFWLSLSFQGRCEKWTRRASVPAWHRDWAGKLSRRERLCRTARRDVYVFSDRLSTTRPPSSPQCWPVWL